MSDYLTHKDFEYILEQGLIPIEVEIEREARRAERLRSHVVNFRETTDWDAFVAASRRWSR